MKKFWIIALTLVATFRFGFSQEIKLSERAQVSIITFGPVSVEQDFVGASSFAAPRLKASGSTPMGEAINLALDKIEERKQIYKQSGISYYRPWIFLVTDGMPDRGDPWATAVQRVRDAEAKKKIAFFAVGVKGADMDVLGQLSSREPLSLQGLKFSEMFTWLSGSLSSVSRSRPGDDVPLQSPASWGTV